MFTDGDENVMVALSLLKFTVPEETVRVAPETVVAPERVNALDIV
jgi:hypothetical protein